MGKRKIGPTDILKGGKGVGAAIAPGAVEMRGELFETAASDIGNQRVAIAEMAIRCSRADPGRAGGIGKGEARRPFLGDQVKRSLDQRLAQVAVMIAAASAR